MINFPIAKLLICFKFTFVGKDVQSLVDNNDHEKNNDDER